MTTARLPSQTVINHTGVGALNHGPSVRSLAPGTSAVAVCAHHELAEEGFASQPIVIDVETSDVSRQLDLHCRDRLVICGGQVVV